MREYVAIFWQFDRLSDICYSTYRKPGIFICCLLVSTTWINTFINFHSTIHSFVNFTQHSQLNSFWSNYLDSSYLLYNWMAESECATQNKKNRIIVQHSCTFISGKFGPIFYSQPLNFKSWLQFSHFILIGDPVKCK